jgi:S1-C subfamily serine protease
VSGQVLDYDMAASFGLDRSGGIIITDLHPISPFGAAGFEVGDVITAVDGQPVISAGEMLFRMSVGGIGNAAVVTRSRNGETSDVSVELISAPDYPPRDFTVLDDDAILTGLELALVNPAVSEELRLALNVEGVVVVNTGVLAARVGLRRGDILEAVNSRVVESPTDVREELSSAGRGVRLYIIRGGSRVQLRFRL